MPLLQTTPRATYRLQLHAGFTFADAAAIVPYLAWLGISHVYTSPILAARAGSTHFYDTVDQRAVSAALGGEGGLRRLVGTLRQHGMGLVVDIVPNHMAVGHADNEWWLDVLEHGQDSPYARFFDIDWAPPDPALQGRLLAPFLAKPYGEALAEGLVALGWEASLGKLCVQHYDHRFPLRPEDQAALAGGGDPALADLSAYRTPAALDRLLERQHYRLAWWGTAADQINWRRFFEIIELAALRVEDRAVFDAVHATWLRLYAEGLIDGVRVDHVDGLAEPETYLRRLHGALADRTAQRPADAPAGPPWIVVEKITSGDERLPAAWPVAGTTGYDFMDEVSAFQHDAAGAEPLARLWAELSGRPAAFEAEEVAARDDILQRSFEGQLALTADAFLAVAQQDLTTRDLTVAALRRSLALIVRHLRVYRSYATGRAAPGSAADMAADMPEAPMRAAIAAAEQDSLDPADGAFRLVEAVLAGTAPGAPALAERAARRLHQLTAPIAAKAVEDTAFYRYGRLLSRNDVGFAAQRMGLEVAAMHARMAHRQAHAPEALLATATHDHKRGEDVRARLAVLSEIPGPWHAALSGWLAELRATDPPEGETGVRIDPGDRAMLLQMVVGAWPLTLAPEDDAGLAALADRLVGWQQKALREAKLRSTWASPDMAYEAAAAAELKRMVSPGANLATALAGFAGRIAATGALNGLVQLALRLTLPGIPDTYQGTELWDGSLVDPDNRRPVDYTARAQALAATATESLPGLLAHWRDGRVKLGLMQRLLQLRAAAPALFTHGAYRPLRVEGPRAEQVFAFERSAGSRRLIVAVPRHAAAMLDGAATPQLPPAWLAGSTLHAAAPGPAEGWDMPLAGTAAAAPAGDGGWPLAPLFAAFPIAVLARGFVPTAPRRGLRRLLPGLGRGPSRPHL